VIPRQPIRLWPGVAAAVTLLLVSVIIPLVSPDAEFFGVAAQVLAVIGGVLCALTIVAWWLFFSRAPWSERLSAIVLIAVVLIATRPITHMSIQNGMMGMMFIIYAIPTASLALVVWAVASRRLSAGARRAAMVAAIVLGCGVWTLARTNGILGGAADLEWRWTKTAEERLLASGGDEPLDSARLPPAPAAAEAPAAETAAKPIAIEAGGSAVTAHSAASEPAKIEPPVRVVTEKPAEWPGFRGPARDGIVRGVRVNTDWAASPPVELWRRAIGPGWSSFAVSGDLLYTQEQRGDDEIVASYKVSTGAPVWRHRDPVRFWESNGGAGPRATPTLSGGRVYTFGATGIVNALDAATGRVVWSRNAASDTHTQVPDWGFASSPLIIDDVVILAVSGSLVGYDVATGKPRWFGPSHGGSYSSPHLFTAEGTPQVVLLTGAGATSVAPASGKLLWEYGWAGSAIVQPALTADGDILINTVGGTGGVGTRRLAVAHGPDGWSVQERWTSNGLKPYFNDFVVHKGHAFGFDGSILACIDLADGKRTWKGGRYGNGQLILLPDQDLLLVMSEEGELALVGATPDQFSELARFPVFTSKTWNHPVVIGDTLLVRNGEQMAAFRLSLVGR
jgi:outer membrane protein assembly factor BamB